MKSESMLGIVMASVITEIIMHSMYVMKLFTTGIPLTINILVMVL